MNAVFGDGGPLVILSAIGDEGKEVYDLVRRFTDREFTLASMRVDDWNRDLSPWEADAVSGGERFGGGAQSYLDKLVGETIPDILKGLPQEPSGKIVAGYSLAGLFALWAVCRTDMFDAAVSASGSLWFPGFTEMLKTATVHADKVYLSLGDKESKTRNTVMSTVEERTRKAYEILSARHIETVFEMNPGNHFKDPSLRTAKGIAWALGDRTD